MKCSERRLEYQRAYYRTHKEQVKQRSIEWQKAHPLEMSEAHRRYYLKNADEIRRKNRERYHRSKAI